MLTLPYLPYLLEHFHGFPPSPSAKETTGERLSCERLQEARGWRRPSVVGGRPSAVGHRRLAIGGRRSAAGDRLQAIGDRQSSHVARLIVARWIVAPGHELAQRSFF